MNRLRYQGNRFPWDKTRSITLERDGDDVVVPIGSTADFTDKEMDSLVHLRVLLPSTDDPVTPVVHTEIRNVRAMGTPVLGDQLAYDPDLDLWIPTPNGGRGAVVGVRTVEHELVEVIDGVEVPFPPFTVPGMLLLDCVPLVATVDTALLINTITVVNVVGGWALNVDVPENSAVVLCASVNKVTSTVNNTAFVYNIFEDAPASVNFTDIVCGGTLWLPALGQGPSLSYSAVVFPTPGVHRYDLKINANAACTIRFNAASFVPAQFFAYALALS